MTVEKLLKFLENLPPACEVKLLTESDGNRYGISSFFIELDEEGSPKEVVIE